MYNKEQRPKVLKICESQKVKAGTGCIFWCNGQTIPSFVHQKISVGISNEKCSFKALAKNGVGDLMAVMHRASKVSEKPSSLMVGLFSDAYVSKQVKHHKYRQGVKNLVNVLWEQIKQS